MTRCQVCEHQSVGEIDALIRAGSRSLAATARAFGLNQKAVQRHAARHVGLHGRAPVRPAPAAAPSGAPAGRADTPNGTVYQAIAAELDEMLAGAESVSAKLAILTEQRRLADSRARTEGPAPSGSVPWQEVDGLAELISDWFVALERFPDARLAMLEVMERRDYLNEKGKEDTTA